MLTAKEKKEIVGAFGPKYGGGESDSGNAAVQVALLTRRIDGLRAHFEAHARDHHSNRGLLKMIGRRRSLLRHIQKKDEAKYRRLIQELNLRK